VVEVEDYLVGYSEEILTMVVDTKFETMFEGIDSPGNKTILSNFGSIGLIDFVGVAMGLDIGKEAQIDSRENDMVEEIGIDYTCYSKN